MIFDAFLFNTQHHKVWTRISGAIQGKEWCLPLHLGVVAIEKGAFGSPLTTVCQFIILSQFLTQIFNQI